MSGPREPLAEIAAAACRPETRDRAIDLAIKALGGGVEDPLVLRLVIEGLETDGRLRDAAAMAQRVTEVAPDNPEAWTEFSRLLRRFGRPWEALDAIRTALSLDPASYAVQLAAASAFMEVNDFAQAARHAEAASDIRGDAVEPPSLLAAIAARRGDFPAARTFAERALALDPTSSTPRVVLAKADLAEGKAGLAAEDMKRLLSRPDLRDARRAEALTALGDALDALGDIGSAFGAYLAAKPAPPGPADPLTGERPQTAIDHARGLETYFRTADPADWAAGAGGGGEAGPGVAGHVFLLGFPRSGTTLLENALASHPGVAALEEADGLIRCGGAFLDADGLDRLGRLTGEEARACRDIYWARVAELLPRPLAGKVFIDKMPLHTLALPVIAKLFPKAKILFSRRDPRDVALSCFRRLSGMNAVMAQFVTIDGAARYYDQIMRLADLYQGLFRLEHHFVRHEDVVAAFDREVGEALDFIGLNWDPAVRDFATRAANAKTPSAGQLVRGLSAEGVGAWKRYAGQMGPALPILAPWA
ncbi:MAG: tetratricopeptide repeat-containing sulfotransferase family protein, partial [Caulobacteraceae bacterium]